MLLGPMLPQELLSFGVYHLRYCQVIESFAMTPTIETPPKEGAEQC